jgi:hypothetical protein
MFNVANVCCPSMEFKRASPSLSLHGSLLVKSLEITIQMERHHTDVMTCHTRERQGEADCEVIDASADE